MKVALNKWVTRFLGFFFALIALSGNVYGSSRESLPSWDRQLRIPLPGFLSREVINGLPPYGKGDSAIPCAGAGDSDESQIFVMWNWIPGVQASAIKEDVVAGTACEPIRFSWRERRAIECRGTEWGYRITGKDCYPSEIRLYRMNSGTFVECLVYVYRGMRYIESVSEALWKSFLSESKRFDFNRVAIRYRECGAERLPTTFEEVIQELDAWMGDKDKLILKKLTSRQVMGFSHDVGEGTIPLDWNSLLCNRWFSWDEVPLTKSLEHYAWNGWTKAYFILLVYQEYLRTGRVDPHGVLKSGVMDNPDFPRKDNNYTSEIGMSK